DRVEDVQVLAQLAVEALGGGEEGMRGDHEAPVALEGADVRERPDLESRVRHVEQQGVLALDRGFDPWHEKDAEAFGPPSQLLGVDALVVAGEGEDVEPLARRLLQQLPRRVADEVVRVFAVAGGELSLQEMCSLPG